MSGTALLVDGAHGVYVPQSFVECYRAKDWGITNEDDAILLHGPDDEWYWETWDNVLDYAKYVDDQGYEWSLWQDGDLWAYCEELMTDEEYKDFFGEERVS